MARAAAACDSPKSIRRRLICSPGVLDKSSYRDGDLLITIPITHDVFVRKYESMIKTNANTKSYLVVLLDNSGSVKQGTIGQVSPSESYDGIQASVLISAMLNNTCDFFTGKFSMMTVDRNVMYQFRYVNNKRASSSSIQFVRKGATKQITMNAVRAIALQKTQTVRNDELQVKKDGTICWDWYWFEFWSDGTVTATYMGTECEDIPGETPCAEAALRPTGELGQIRIDCYSSSGGGGGNNSISQWKYLDAYPTGMPGGDTIYARGCIEGHASDGAFNSETIWYGSWIKQNAYGYTYKETASSVVYSARQVSGGFRGTILGQNNTTYNVQKNRTYGYVEFFSAY